MGDEDGRGRPSAEESQPLLRAHGREVSVDMLKGLLAAKTSEVLTVEEINEAIAQAGAAAGEGRDE